MGMFDYLKVDKDIPLPTTEELKCLEIDPHTLEFQTKDLDNLLSVYTIAKNSLYKDDKKINYHGMLIFGSYYTTNNTNYLIDYEAKFTDGILQNIRIIKFNITPHESNKRIKVNLSFNKLDKILIFIQNKLIVLPFSLLGVEVASNFPGSFYGDKLSLNFYCPKFILGYKSEYRSKIFGFSISEVSTEILFRNLQYRKEFVFKVLGFGLTICYNTVGRKKTLEDISNAFLHQ